MLFSNDTGKLGKTNSECSYQESHFIKQNCNRNVHFPREMFLCFRPIKLFDPVSVERNSSQVSYKNQIFILFDFWFHSPLTVNNVYHMLLVCMWLIIRLLPVSLGP